MRVEQQQSRRRDVVVEERDTGIRRQEQHQARITRRLPVVRRARAGPNRGHERRGVHVRGEKLRTGEVCSRRDNPGRAV